MGSELTHQHKSSLILLGLLHSLILSRACKCSVHLNSQKEKQETIQTKLVNKTTLKEGTLNH